VDLLLLLLPAIVLVALVVILAVLAERSIKSQRGSLLRRGRKERLAAGRVVEKHGRWSGGGGGAGGP
jgi:uncharacterized membrane protein